MKMRVTFFKEFEVVFSSGRKTRADNLPAFLVCYKLCLECVLFLFTGVIPALFFLGLSMGLSAASINTTSKQEEALSNDFFPGNLKAECLTKILSMLRMVRQTEASLTS
jgi:hypothetical protein